MATVKKGLTEFPRSSESTPALLASDAALVRRQEELLSSFPCFADKIFRYKEIWLTAIVSKQYHKIWSMSRFIDTEK